MMSPRYALSEFRANWRDRSFWADAPGFVWRNGLTAPFRRLGFACQRRRAPDTLSLLEADWDNCLLLDACRYDAFRAVLDDTGRLERRLAPGSQTGAFLRATLPPGSTHPDLVYVTANPRVATEPTGECHAIEHLWRTEWNDSTGTVLPAATKRAALDAIDRYPEKRLLVHFVQPHIPYIGEFASGLPGGASIQTMRPEQENRAPKPYSAVTDGSASPRRIHLAYRESLEIAMHSIRELVSALPGKTVVTADHGELLGESVGRTVGEVSRWGHPAKTPVSPLLDVPYWEPAVEGRRPISAGGTTSDETTVDHDRLAALGYT